MGRGVGVVEDATVGTERRAVARRHAAEDFAQRSVGIEAIERRPLVRLVARQAADPEASKGVDAAVVEALVWLVRERSLAEGARHVAPGVDPRAALLARGDLPAPRPPRPESRRPTSCDRWSLYVC